MKLRRVIFLILLMVLMCSGCERKDEAYPEQQALSEKHEEDTLEKHEPVNDGMESETENMGEGVPMPIEVDLNEGDTYRVKDTIKIGTEQGVLYELTIDEIEYTDQRDEYVQDPGNVLLVTYTYKNISEEAVFIDDMSFQMMDTDEGTALDMYYLSDIQVPELVEKGGSCTAQLAFSSAEKVDSVVLVYHDIVNTEILPVKIAINDLQ